MTLALRALPSRPPVVGARLEENATLISRRDLSERMASFSVSLDTALPTFLPGQYVSLGLKDGQRFIQRPYSIASPPGDRRDLDFFIRRVADGAFTSRLWPASPGTRLRVGPPKGLFTLDREDPRHRLFIASGTGLAPFLSMLAAERRLSAATPVLLLHGASHASELGFGDQFDELRRAGLALEYLPTVSRGDSASTSAWRGHAGRVESLLAEVCAERSLSPASTAAYLCGNPGTIEACEEILAARGFGPLDLRVERYGAAVIPSAAERAWPSDRDPAMVA
jgi:ferredoxin--NADP+ reductase